MAIETEDRYVHYDYHRQELKNFAHEQLGAHPTGADLYEGRMWQLTTGTKDVFMYKNGAVRKIAFVEDLNKFGAYIGGLAPSGGIPDGTTAGQIGSGIDAEGATLAGTASIQAGDWWLMTDAATIVGIQGADELSINDKLVALQDNPTTAAHFLGVQMNLNDNAIGTQRVLTMTTALTAATAFDFTANMAAMTPPMTAISNIMVEDDATGKVIGLSKNINDQSVTSNADIASVTITVTGS